MLEPQMESPFVNSIASREGKKIINGIASVRNFSPIKEHFTKAFLQTSGLDSIWLVVPWEVEWSKQ